MLLVFQNTLVIPRDAHLKKETLTMSCNFKGFGVGRLLYIFENRILIIHVVCFLWKTYIHVVLCSIQDV